QRGGAATENRLLAEQVGLGLFAEVGLDDAGATAAVGAGVGQGNILGAAGGVLVDGDQGGHAAPFHVGAAHGVAGALGGDHDHVQVGAGHDQLEVDVEAVGKGQGRAFLQVGGDAGVVDIPLVLVGGEDHHQVGALHGVLDLGHFQAGVLGLFPGRGALAQGDRDVFHTGVLEVQRVGMALGAVTHDGDAHAADDGNVTVLIVI